MSFALCVFVMSKLTLRFVFLTAIMLVTLIVYVNILHSHTKNVFLRGLSNNVCKNSQSINVNKPEEMLRSIQGSSVKNLRSFNISRPHVMVFLHIQKTGGTYFDKNLVKNLLLERPCKRTPKSLRTRFECRRPNSNELWLYSRYSTGWKCGLHADWTTLTNCIPKRLKPLLGIRSLNETQLFYVSFLRDPVKRFLSEFKHVQRGATWRKSTYFCNNTKYDLPYCYKGMHWRGVLLSEFLSCPHNLAFNRQTRMLANLNEFGCYNHKDSDSQHIREYNENMLRSAKRTLRNLAYFGLVEYQRESQNLFEKTFGLKFKNDFRQIRENDTRSNQALKEVTPEQLSQIQKVNILDRQLYNYAKTLFFERLRV